jgi:hypothetical protein
MYLSSLTYSLVYYAPKRVEQKVTRKRDSIGSRTSIYAKEQIARRREACQIIYCHLDSAIWLTTVTTARCGVLVQRLQQRSHYAKPTSMELQACGNVVVGLRNDQTTRWLILVRYKIVITLLVCAVIADLSMSTCSLQFPEATNTLLPLDVIVV